MDDEGFARVETRVRAYVRPAPSRDALPLAYDNPALAEGDAGPDLASGGLSQAVTDFMVSLDAKLDTVISLLNQKRLEDEFAAEVEVVEVGGDGLRFATTGDFADGDALEFALVLNQFPLRVASVVGVVEPADSGPGRPVTFTRVREADLEALVGFVFQEQRARIRETKWAT
ncbi:PilZ domain-containing protein [Desulfocurvus sp. DL9XJH121]